MPSVADIIPTRGFSASIEAARTLQAGADIEVVCQNNSGFNADECFAAVSSLVDDVVGGSSIERTSSTNIWLVIAGTLVFFMHAGFSMLEAGSVRKPNVINIMFKNIGTVAIGAVIYWLLGFGFAYGTNDDANSFVGNNFFAFEFGDESAAFFFFQYTFAATAATIVSGAVAERIQLPAYFVVAALLTGFVFPVVTHWVWSADGFMSAFTADGSGELVKDSIGLIDYAGSGVVHATGGLVALMGAWIIGPRTGKFVDGEAIAMPVASHTLMTLGTFILWFGWYGFNPGSTLLFDGTNIAKAAVTTTLAPSAAGVTGTIYSRVVKGYFDLPLLLNCVLAGLVSITAGCTAVADISAIFIGIIGAFIYIASSKLIEFLKIDDPIGAAPVHGFCGLWGVIAVGIFLNDSAVNDSYGAIPDRGSQFSMQVAGALIIAAWALAWGAVMFSVLKFTGILRVPVEVEKEGLDESEHGGAQILHF